MGFRETMARATRDTFASLGEVGTYTDNAGTVEGARFIVSLNVNVLGDFGQVVGKVNQVRVLLEDVPTPMQGATVTVPSGTYRLTSKEYSDGFYERWNT